MQDREENNDTKDVRSVREVESRMGYSDYKHVLFGLQALQPNWNMCVEAWILI